MIAPLRTRHLRSSRFVARLRQLFRRSLRFSNDEPSGAAHVPNRPGSTVDFGDLSVAQLVHDLRNDVMVMVACAEQIGQLTPPGQAEQEMTEIKRRAERATVGIRELLHAARPRAAARGAVNLNDIVAATAVTLSLLMGERVRVDLRLSSVPARVTAAQIEVERILLNLALNARDAMRVSGGVLTIETTMVAFDLYDQADGLPAGTYARLTVSDTGSGMSAALKARVFEPFFTTKRTGTGLGLSSVAFTVGHLRGMVSVDSEPGRGTSVVVHFPAA